MLALRNKETGAVIAYSEIAAAHENAEVIDWSPRDNVGAAPVSTAPPLPEMKGNLAAPLAAQPLISGLNPALMNEG